VFVPLLSWRIQVHANADADADADADLRDFFEFSEREFQAAPFDMIVRSVSKQLVNGDDISRNLYSDNSNAGPSLNTLLSETIQN